MNLAKKIDVFFVVNTAHKNINEEKIKIHDRAKSKKIKNKFFSGEFFDWLKIKLA